MNGNKTGCGHIQCNEFGKIHDGHTRRQASDENELRLGGRFEEFTRIKKDA